jgi:hypothetical protein
MRSISRNVSQHSKASGLNIPVMGEAESLPDAHAFMPYQKELEQIHAVIGEYDGKEPPHIAVIADPFAGQSVFMEEVLSHYPHRVTHLPFYSVVKNTDFIDTLRRTQEIVLMERCHFLALRRIGGFTALDAFLDFLATTDKLFITGWNSFSWSYLNAAHRIEDIFSVVIRLPRLDTPALKAMILAHSDHPVTYIDDTPSEEKHLFSVVRHPIRVPFSDAPLYLPWIRFSPSRNASDGEPTQEEAQTAIFDRIAQTAQGNYGVAQRLWERSLEADTIKMSRIPTDPCTVSMSINESCLLMIILSMESISFADLEDIAQPEIDVKQVLYRLGVQGLVEEEKGHYRVKPEALNCVTTYLKRNRMVW